MVTKDREYFRQRVAEESAAALSSPCAYAREVHRDLAERYSAKLRLIEVLAGDASFSEPRHEARPAQRSASR